MMALKSGYHFAFETVQSYEVNTMIRPASEIEYPPSEALCTKARMIARMSALSENADNLMAVIAQRIGAEEPEYAAQIEAMNQEQDRLINNMRRIIRS